MLVIDETKMYLGGLKYGNSRIHFNPLTIDKSEIKACTPINHMMFHSFIDEEQAERLEKRLFRGESKSENIIKTESLSQEDCDDLEVGFGNICDKLDFIIDLIGNNFPGTNDIYLSEKDFALLCKSFGGKVKKYKGHNIIVQ